MEKALWIIAICEIVRALQNVVPTVLEILHFKKQQGVYDEFIDNMRMDNREWAKSLLKAFEEKEKE